MIASSTTAEIESATAFHLHVERTSVSAFVLGRSHTHRALRIITIRTSASIEIRQHEGRMPRMSGVTGRPAGEAVRLPGRLSAPARPHGIQVACPRSRGRNGQVAPT
ncbi:hypothetical protein Snoj_80470 [Streptomyces nojiriensis]|uniref:Uncharacterized protein n=1 Tax=Streptomyces nojiriensis TaxID=66374 RepID=A0ABQ3T161_9ACTN|nr:hypothetical protein GCM10010205_01840 [Streptomyces nojiriensis]GHI74129.1 hypothetical protein Snoj_80470 [Streptomyces nojiriensis]